MKKRNIMIIAIIFTVAIIASFAAGCGASNNSEASTASGLAITAEAAEAKENHFNFELITEDYLNDIRFYRESSTDVMYVLYREGSSYAAAGGLTVMLDPETGKPLTYENWKANYQNK